MTSKRAVRILIGKVGLDGHDRGVKVISRALRDAGYEVIYTGLHNTPQLVVETAIQEDVDAVGISILSGAHNYIFPELMRLFKEKGVDDVMVFGGGIVPKKDIENLKEKGVKTIFEPGTSTDEIVRWVGENVTVRDF
ncbi:MAG TPA: cobalamin B12-binding domain-containing protein [Thermodesulfobacteriota bacterium]|nr:cobalamin B12-binding domain-containing protein [Thermodesulfobacteriota bacterium]